jgi:NTE family protein
MRRLGGPEIILNATDLTSGGRFPFSPQVFVFICSDLDSYPVADAVAASSAVPIVFPPIRLRNYAGTCDFRPPEWSQQSPDAHDSPLRQALRDNIIDLASSVEEREYIHLRDGGISDNLGLANAMAGLAMVRNPRAAMRDLGHEDLELILVISVNAEVDIEQAWDGANRSVSAREVVNGLSHAQIKARNQLAVKLARASFTELANQLSTPDKRVRFELVEVSFDKVSDPDERARLRKIETSFRISDKKVDRLIHSAHTVVRESPELSRAVSLLDERNQ